eukprot:6202966-Pleurochrysis_carterae.AAC.2
MSMHPDSARSYPHPAGSYVSARYVLRARLDIDWSHAWLPECRACCVLPTNGPCCTTGSPMSRPCATATP